MNQDASLRPYGDPDERVGTPHIGDYWHVVSRRLWLVLLIFGITTASAIWAVSRQRVFHQAHISLQVRDPTQPARGLVTAPRLSGMDIFVDPMQSEIQVLRSSQIAMSVIDSLGLRLRPASPDLVRSSLARDIQVASDAPDGVYELVYDAAGQAATLRDGGGTVLGSAPVGDVLATPFLSFTVQSPPAEELSYTLHVVPATAVVGEITGNLSASPRESTNIIDAYFLSADPALAPAVLNVTAVELRERGVQQLRTRARADIQFIETRLDSARQKLDQAAEEIQRFKESQEFTNLTAREQQLLNRIQVVQRNIESLDQQRSVLSGLAREMEQRPLTEIDLVAVLAELPEGTNQQIRSLINQVQNKRQELRALITEEQLARGHPRLRFVEEEIERLGTQLMEATRANVRVLEGRLGDFFTEQDSLRRQQAQFPDLEQQLQALQQQKELDQETYQFLLSQLYQSQIAAAAVSPYVDVVDPASGAVPLSPRGRVNVVLGALLGLILGVGAAFFLEYLDRTVRTSSDVESLLGIPVLGIIPRLRRVGEDDTPDQFAGKGAPMVVALDPLDPAAEAYRNLRMNLMFMSTEDEPIRTVLFSSPGPDEGKSTTAVNFAVMLAQQGKRVLLLDADLRRPSLHRALDLLREPGLTNLLVGDASLRETLRPNVLPNLDMLPSGPFPPNPSELLNSKAMHRLLEEVQGKYSHVIVDSPPILAVTDAAVLAAHADGVVLVLRSGETEQRAAERSVEQLRRLGARIFGAVLNEVASTTTEEGYYLQYYYSYHTTEPTGWSRLRQGLSKARFW